MAKSGSELVDQYIAGQPEAVQAALEKVRGAIRKALPDAEEVISYQIPAYRQHGRIVIFFAGWKEHYSVYPAIGGLVEEFAKELAPYELSKGTIRFPLGKRVPVGLIGRLAKYRLEETEERVSARKAAPRKPKRPSKQAARSR